MAEVYLHSELLQSMPRSANQRRRILDFVRALAADPDMKGDFTDRDDTQRTRQIKVIGDHAITYWHDAAVNTIMVVDIRNADR